MCAACCAPRGLILWIAVPDSASAFRARDRAQTAPDLRLQRSFDGAEVERGRLRSQDDHGKNADSLGAGSRASCARLTRSNCTRTGRKSKRIGEKSKQAGKIKSFSTPAALALSPRLMEQNRQRLRAIDFAAARQALEEAIAREGFSRETFRCGFQLARSLEAVARGTMADSELAQGAARLLELVVPGRSLLRS